MKRMTCAAAAVLAACIEPPGAKNSPSGPTVLGIAPTVDVALTEPVRIAFSETVSLGTVDIVRSDGRPVRFGVATDGSELVLTPDAEWPVGEALFVTVGAGFETADGRELVDPADPLVFTTTPGGLPSPRPVVRAPTPGSSAPVNLRYIAVASSPPLPSPLGPAYLAAGDARVPVDVVERRDGAVLLETRGALTPSTAYELVLTHDMVAPPDPAVSTIRTSTSVDDVPPTVTSTRVTIEGDRLLVDVDADEPIVARGVALSLSGRVIELAAHPMAARQTRLETVAPVHGGAVLSVDIDIFDLSGNGASPLRFEIVFPQSVAAHITELVPTALHDWGDSEGGEVPFDARPGTGSVTSTDEWVEIVNDSLVPVALPSAGLELRTIDRTPAITRVAGAPALYFGDGGHRHAWWPGEALVVRTRGDMSQRDLTVELWSGSTLLDRVTLGDGPGVDHAGGSPIDTWHESIARDASGKWRWCQPTPGDPLPAASCL